MNIENLIECAKAKARARGQHRNASHMECITWTGHYSEPGYSTDKRLIVFGNWNPENFTPEQKRVDVMLRLAKALERYAELEWEDEWTTCGDCGGAIRTQPDSFGWQQSYWEDDSGAQCAECAQKHPSALLHWLEGNHRRALTFDKVDLSAHGFTQLQSGFEHGFHSGQDASPELIAKELRKVQIERFIFKLDSTGQFDFNFSVWIHGDDLAKAAKADLSPERTNGPSISQGLDRALRAASQQAASLPGSGCIVSKLNPYDGTAQTERVPQNKLEEHFRKEN